MLVKHFMTKHVFTVEPEESMQRALNLLKEHKVNMLPVVQEGNVVGIVSDRDLKRASASDATVLDAHELRYLLNKIKIKDIMSKNPVTVPPDYTIEETAEVLMTHHISGAPVLDEQGRMVGVITRNDLFKALIALSGLGKKGILFAFQVEDRPGTIKEISDVIRQYGARIGSIMTSYDRVREGWRNVFIRAYDIDRSRMDQMLQDLQRQAQMLYLVDHKENVRRIFSEGAPASFQV